VAGEPAHVASHRRPVHPVDVPEAQEELDRIAHQDDVPRLVPGEHGPPQGEVELVVRRLAHERPVADRLAARRGEGGEDGQVAEARLPDRREGAPQEGREPVEVDVAVVAPPDAGAARVLVAGEHLVPQQQLPDVRVVEERRRRPGAVRAVAAQVEEPDLLRHDEQVRMPVEQRQREGRPRLRQPHDDEMAPRPATLHLAEERRETLLAAHAGDLRLHRNSLRRSGAISGEASPQEFEFSPRAPRPRYHHGDESGVPVEAGPGEGSSPREESRAACERTETGGGPPVSPSASR
jgi:hypothetical protein